MLLRAETRSSLLYISILTVLCLAPSASICGCAVPQPSQEKPVKLVTRILSWQMDNVDFNSLKSRLELKRMLPTT